MSKSVGTTVEAPVDALDASLPLVLHISSDYLDPLRPPPLTTAVVRLVDRLTDNPQVVVSLQRVSNPMRVFWRDLGMIDGRRLIVHAYFAPKFGIGMFSCQWMVARRISRFLREENLKPAIVHAHRFTFEGISAWLLAKEFGAALFCSIRGEVEKKVFAAKPLYRPLFRRMARDAQRIFYVSAWFKKRFEQYSGVDPQKTRLLPNIVNNARPVIQTKQPEQRLIIPMSLRYIDKKGLPELLKAFVVAGSALDGITLEIIGEGPPDTQDRVRSLIAENGLEGRAVLLEPMKNHDLLEYFTTALAVVLPSHNETFGMVYPEALFAGTPILFALDSGIDGYLDGLDVGVGVTPGDVDAIANGLIKLVRENTRFRASIESQANELFDRFSPDLLTSRYAADIKTPRK